LKIYSIAGILVTKAKIIDSKNKKKNKVKKWHTEENVLKCKISLDNKTESATKFHQNQKKRLKFLKIYRIK
jgi:hypothetical protein